MGKLKLKHKQLLSALDRFYDAVVDFDQFERYINPEYVDKERVYRTYGDSLIRRFEFNIDLFWKYLKRYLEEELKQTVKISGPKPIVREACKAKLITEDDAEKIIQIIEERNNSSHIYKEEIADQISNKISEYYETIKKYADKLIPHN